MNFSDYKRYRYNKEISKIRKRLDIWRKKVLERDGNKCTKCGATEQLQVHHIRSFILYPKYRTCLTNGKTMCVTCHQKTRNIGMKVMNNPKYEKYNDELYKEYKDEYSFDNEEYF